MNALREALTQLKIDCSTLQSRHLRVLCTEIDKLEAEVKALQTKVAMRDDSITKLQSQRAHHRSRHKSYKRKLRDVVRALPTNEIEGTFEFVVDHVAYVRTDMRREKGPSFIEDWDGKTVLVRLKEIP